MQPSIRERYEQLTQIGATNLCKVFRAYDRLEGQWVALKQITTPLDMLEYASRPANDVPDSVQRLALMRELHRLAEVRHHSVVPLLDYGINELGMPYFTGSLFQNAQPILIAAQSMSFSEKISLLGNLLDGLTYLHRHRTLHRGLRPETVIVSQKRALLADIGLTILLDPGSTTERAALVNLIAYIAPEILRGASPSEASDMYAVGLLAYQMFVGRHPLPQVHEAMSQPILNMQHVLTSVLYEAPDMQRLVDTLKGGQATEQRWRLIDAIRRLLVKSPDDRIGSAAARAILTPGSSDPPAISSPPIYFPQPVEHAAEIVRLDAALSTLINERRGSSWMLSGSGGAGKALLMDDLQVRAKAHGLPTARGYAEGTGDRPFDPLRLALPSLILQASPQGGSTLPDSILGSFKPLIPDLERLAERTIPDLPLLRGRDSESRFTDAVEGLLSRLRDPSVIFLEEMQWGDDALALLARLHALIERLPVLLIMGWRETDELSPPDLPGVTLIRLNNLSAPLFPEGFEPDIAGRLAQITPAAWDLLYAAAVAGRTIDPALIDWLNPMQPVEPWLQMCAEAGVIRIRGQRWVFVHENARNQVLAQASAEQQQDLHRQIAQGIAALYGDGPDQAGRLAYHWMRAESVVPEAHYRAVFGLHAYSVGAVRVARRSLTRVDAIARAGQLEPSLHAQVTQALQELDAGS